MKAAKTGPTLIGGKSEPTGVKLIRRLSPAVLRPWSFVFMPERDNKQRHWKLWRIGVLSGHYRAGIKTRFFGLRRVGEGGDLEIP